MSDGVDRTKPPAVILAAGAGRRLGALAVQYSKPMVPVAGRPLIDWVIERLRSAVGGPLIVVGHRDDAALAVHLEQRHPDVVRVVQSERRGIADALRLALPHVGDRPYLACACDSLFDVADLDRVLKLGMARAGRVVVAVVDMGVDATATRSAVRMDGERVVEIVEKPPSGSAPSGWVAMPLYWLPPQLATYLDAAIPAVGEGYVSTAISGFIRDGGEAVVVPVGGRVEITSADDVAVASRLLGGEAARGS